MQPPPTSQRFHTDPATLGFNSNQEVTGEKESSEESEQGAEEENMDTVDEEYGTKPHHVSKQIESLQKGYDDKSMRFSGKDTDNFDSKLKVY